MTGALQNWARRYPLAIYFVLVFGLEWILFFALASVVQPLVALLIGSWLPNVVGVLVAGMARGRAGLRELLSKVLLWRINFKWYAIALFLPPTMGFLAIGLYVLSGRPAPQAAPMNQLLPIAVLAVFTGAMGEELGWRGTALPHLQSRWSPLVSSLILGVLWGLYHLPAFLMSGLPQEGLPVLPLLAGATGLTILITWTFNRTHGSLIPVFLYHFAFNFTLNAGGLAAVPALLWVFAGVVGLSALAVIVADWARFSSSGACSGVSRKLRSDIHERSCEQTRETP
jgi:membrane protease YdiL (CAAX protease family)